MAYDSDVAIQAIVFTPDGGVDITYAEQRDITAVGTTVRQHLVPPDVLSEAEVEEVRDAVRELLDKALALKVAQRISHR